VRRQGFGIKQKRTKLACSELEKKVGGAFVLTTPLTAFCLSNPSGWAGQQARHAPDQILLRRNICMQNAYLHPEEWPQFAFQLMRQDDVKLPDLRNQEGFVPIQSI
jgi:hypothetical protein